MTEKTSGPSQFKAGRLWNSPGSFVYNSTHRCIRTKRRSILKRKSCSTSFLGLSLLGNHMETLARQANSKITRRAFFGSTFPAMPNRTLGKLMSRGKGALSYVATKIEWVSTQACRKGWPVQIRLGSLEDQCDLFLPPQGFRPEGEIPRRHSSNSRV